jgi:phosphatidylglycerophosphatase A
MSHDPRRELVRLAWRSPAGWLAMGLGSGLSPVAPGTAGSLLALALAAVHVLLVPAGWQGPLGLTLLALVAVFGTLAAGRVGRCLDRHDHPAIVVDEWVGQWLVLLAVPLEPLAWAAAFVLFRAFDIAKPWPVRAADRRVGGGFGVMLDDVLAAGWAVAVLAAWRVSPWWPWAPA